jgi:pimeloyl-ACP methyl ester carboxylesterase
MAFLGYAAAFDSFELQRFRMLAELTRNRFVVVETPGYGTAGTRLTKLERRAALHGDLGPLATRMDGAASAVVGHPPDVVLGYSMGASMAAAAARRRAESAPGRVSTLILVEPVAVRKWSASALVAAMRKENELVDIYLDETKSVSGAAAPADRTPGTTPAHRGWIDMLVTANTLRGGRLAADVAAGVAPGSRLVVVHGSNSFLSERAGCARVLQAARSQGATAVDVPAAGSHGLWLSLPRVAELAPVVAAAAGCRS